MRIGVIGCGSIAQIMHVPHLLELPEADLIALCDPVSELVEKLAERYNIPNRYTSVEAMIDSVGDSLDGVVVATPAHTHADVVEPLLQAEIDTFVEKPLTLDPAEADRLVAAGRTSGASAMVGYMKRYDPSYQQAQRAVAELEATDTIAAYDVDPDHGRIIDEVYDLLEADVPDELIETGRNKRLNDGRAAIGGEGDTVAPHYCSHLEHACHDINVLRGLFGNVTAIKFVDLYADGRYLTAHLEYEHDDGTPCVLDSGFSDRKWFEEWVRIDTPDQALSLEFGNPYIKNTPTTFQVKEGTESLSDSTSIPSYQESFKAELEHFIGVLKGDRPVVTTLEEARDDVVLMADLFRTYADREPLGNYPAQ